ncbi:MAG: glycosyltransferase family 2 protein [Desulfuromonadales bacterium]|nr:glycosyltransferase family 2 protein [Desulfuromonadales bacterium]
MNFHTDKQVPKVAIVTPIHDGIEDTLEYLRSLAGVTYPNFEVTIVDDGSTDGSRDTISRDFPHVRILRGDGNLWWSGGTNLGIRDALERGAEFVLTMNNDIQVAPDVIDALVMCATNNLGAIVGGKIYFMKDPERVWSAGGELSWGSGRTLVMLGHDKPDAAEFSVRRHVDFFTGMCVLIPAQVFSRIGLYDAVNFPQYHADSEFTLRARKAGIPILFEPSAKVWNRVESTFMQRFVMQGALTLKDIGELLTSFRSPMNVKEYWLLHKRYCPSMLIPIAFMLRMARTVLFLLKIKWSILKGGKDLERIGV